MTIKNKIKPPKTTFPKKLLKKYPIKKDLVNGDPILKRAMLPVSNNLTKI